MRFLLLGAFAAAASPPASPHIVFIMMDDWGYNDVGWRSPDIETPTITRLSADGIRLQNYYSQHLCTPARTALMTGRYPIRSGMTFGVIGTPDEPWGLPTNESTLAEGLKSLGYATHLVGKWHLGLYQNASLPVSRGFDTQFGYSSGEEDYWTHAIAGHLDFLASDGDAAATIVTAQNASYSTELFSAVAESIVRAHDASAQPLFLYIAQQGVHCPLEAPARWRALCDAAAFPDDDRRSFCAMSLAADSLVENVTGALAANAAMLDETVLVVAGDNGGLVSCAGNNWPLRGQKATLWEGGVRNSAFVWAGWLPAAQRGAAYDGLVHVSDWRPTLQGLAGDAAAAVAAGFELDGIDVWAALVAGAPSPRVEIVHNIDEATPAPSPAPTAALEPPPQQHSGAALRLGRWKLLVGVGNDTWHPVPGAAAVTAARAATLRCAPGGGACVDDAEPGPAVTALFDVESDPEERVDLYAARPDIVANLSARLDYWRARAIPPQNQPSDPTGSAVAAKCGAWVPFVPEPATCPPAWCADVAQNCTARAAAEGCDDDAMAYYCTQTCGRC